MTEKEAVKALKDIGARSVHIGAVHVDGKLCYGVSFKIHDKVFESTVFPNGNWFFARSTVMAALEKFIAENKAA